MSYILEALKKADRERVAGHVPDLETVHQHEPVPRKSRRWVWVLAALVVSNAVFVALLATRHDARHNREEIASRAVPGERIARQPEPARSQMPPGMPPAVRPPPANVARVAPRVTARETGTVAPEPAVRPATAESAAVVAPPAIESPAPSVAARPSASPAHASATGPIPDWDDLSLDFRSGLSMPRMDVHVYDPDPRRRFVLINLQKLREGEKLPNGAVLEEILPDGIVLSYQGTRFHYGK